MPVEAQSNTYTQPSGLSSLLSGAGGILDFLNKMNIGGNTPSPTMTRQQRVNELVAKGVPVGDATNIAMGEGL
jgi:hypothetical protein